MNERIELLKQEAFRITEWEELDYDKILEKVVELTVKECGMFTDSVTRNLMMKYFGVKE